MKEILKRALAETTDLIGLDLLIQVSKQILLLPFYHTVSDSNLPHIKHLYPITSVKRFNEDLDFFQEKFSSVDHHFLISSVKNPSLKKDNHFFLSFDDGLREFHDVVAPILIRRGISATCFVNTDFIDNKDMFFRLKISILIENIFSKQLTKGQLNSIVSLMAQHELRYKHPKDLLQITDKNKILADLIAPILDISFSEYLSEHKPYLTTEQIKSLTKQGFSIGAHSASHPYYPNLSTEVQVEETLKSVRYVTKNFNADSRLFSFPYTDFEITKSFFDSIKNEVDLTFGTANMKLDEIDTNFQRIPMEIWNRKSAASIVKSEYVYFILKKMLGKHIIHRS